MDRMNIPPFGATRRGDAKSQSLVVLVAGFPDSETSAFGPVLDSLAEHHRVFSLCLPDYSQSLVSKKKRWGYSWSELLEGLHLKINELQTNDGVLREKYFLVGHDWGSHLVSLYENKYSSFVKKIVLLDVFTPQRKHNRLTNFQIFSILSYQWSFALSYIIHETISRFIGNRIYFMAGKIFMYCFPSIGKASSPGDASFCYPYLHYWKDIFLKRALKPRFPETPTLYLFGGRKTLHFHSKEAIKELALRPGNKVKEVDDAGHWLTLEKPEEVTKEILSFLEDD